jgi:predicted TIM-barrel fold metal-dependent hydrolase
MTALVDTNVYLGAWPFRRLYGERLDELLARLRAADVQQAWVGSFAGLWQRDLADVNEQLAKACQAADAARLLPFGSVNPTLPAWQDDLARCHEQHRMRGIRLHPNYHGYKLDAPAVADLLHEAHRRRLIVQIALSMEDERTQSPLAHVPHVDPLPLVDLLKQHPKLPVVLINAFRSITPAAADKLADAGQVYFDIAMLESVAGIAKLIAAATLDRVLFGSHFPFFYHESAVLKLQE